MPTPEELKDEETIRRFNIEMVATICFARNKYLKEHGEPADPYPDQVKDGVRLGYITEDDIPSVLQKIQEMETEQEQ